MICDEFIWGKKEERKKVSMLCLRLCAQVCTSVHVCTYVHVCVHDIQIRLSFVSIVGPMIRSQ